MNFKLKYATFADLNACVKVEKDTMGNYCYLEDCWHHFFKSKGKLICVYHEDIMVGIGRFTVLGDKSAWLETLRVIPEYQSKGVGKLIYSEYLKLAEKYHCKSIAMFTGIENKASKGLAIKHGLSLSAVHTGYHLNSFDKANAYDFKNISWQKACEVILPLKDDFNGYMTSNRTFYQINAENIMQFASEGKVFYSESDGSVIVVGSRFQHSTALHIQFMAENYTKCIEFATNLAKSKSVLKLSCTFARENAKLEKALTENNFEKETANLITMQRIF